VSRAPPLPEHKLLEGFVKGKLSIIMPAYNEAECIVESIHAAAEQFGAICNDWEIILVDDGSTDKTRERAKVLVNDSVKVVGYERNKGKGYALKEGFNFVTGEFTFLVDSDLEIRARDLHAYVKALEGVDIAIGSKRHPLSVVWAPMIRRFLSLSFNILERLLTGVRASDTQAGLKCARSSSLYKILPLLSVKRYAFDSELLVVASLLDFKIRELPVHVELKSTFSMRHVLRMLVDLLGISYRLRIRRWYQKNIPGLSETYRPVIPW
jgi:glycosyltransferase involved in cell wall biosynthesis